MYGRSVRLRLTPAAPPAPVASACAPCAAYVHVHYHREQTGLVYFGGASKLIVGLLLLKGYLCGVIHWPIGLVGACFECAVAVLFIRDLARRARERGVRVSVDMKRS